MCVCVCCFDQCILSGEIDTRTFVRSKKKRSLGFGEAVNDENRNSLLKRGLYLLSHCLFVCVCVCVCLFVPVTISYLCMVLVFLCHVFVCVCFCY